MNYFLLVTVWMCSLRNVGGAGRAINVVRDQDQSLFDLLATKPQALLRNIPANTNISSLCYDHLRRMLRDDGTSSWVRKAFNSWGKPNKDLTSEHQFHLGDFDSCQSIQTITDDKTTFKSRYCLTEFTVRDSHAVSIASCVPTSCQTDDVINIYNESKLNPQIALTATSKCRETNHPFPLTNLILLSLPLAVVVISIVATFHDLKSKWLARGDQSYSAAGHVKRPLLAFSLYSNIRAKLQTNQPPDSITCLHGMKVFSFTWVALNHIGARIMYSAPITNPSFVPNFHKSILLSPTLKAHIAVNSFFTLSGILAAHTLLKQYQKKRLNVDEFLRSLPSSYLHRYLRLTPAYVFLIIINWKLVCYLYNGPFWLDCDTYQSTCSYTWYYNMLYINNFKMDTGHCSPWGWYLSNEMQFALFAPFVVYALHQFESKGLKFCITTILASTLMSFILSNSQRFYFVNFNLAEFAFESSPGAEEFSYYFVPWQRYKSYGVGILTGYIIFRLKQHEKTIPKVANMLLWCTAAVLCISTVFGPFPVTSGQRVGTLFESNMYNTFSGVAWSIGISCVVISCSLGSGGWINRFLSCRLFITLSNITYCTFLVHEPVSQMMVYGRRYVPTLTLYSLYGEVYLCIAVSSAVGFVFSVLFELPFAHLVRVYLSQSSRTNNHIPKNEGKEKLTKVTSDEKAFEGKELP